MEQALKDMAKWEYDCLVRDTDGEFSYEGGWEVWCEEVFMKDDAWDEIRSDVINSFKKDEEL